jgi:GNAT superfamily N-acetyltransferase
MMFKIRSAEKSEIEWVNQCYDEVEFVHSHFDNEIIAVAEYGGQKAGLGRLVTVDDKHLELGGMYVFESFRGKGVAKEIVQFLLGAVKSHQTVYCIPFEHLIPFYKQCGFTTCSCLDLVPQELLKKYLWCKEKYAHPTSLLIFEVILD